MNARIDLSRRMLRQAVRILRRVPGNMLARDLYERLSPSQRQSRQRDSEQVARLWSAYPDVLSELRQPHRSDRVVLIVGQGRPIFAFLETVIRYAFRLSGYRAVVLIPSSRQVKQAYRALGEETTCELHDFQSVRPEKLKAAELCFSNLDELLDIRRGEVRCGKYAASTLMRSLRVGQFDFSDPAVKGRALEALAYSVDNALTAKRLIDKLKPDAAVFVDRGYSPAGELFDICIERDIPAYTWNAGHRNDIVMLKRYERHNADEHPFSLSPESWKSAKEVPWHDGIRAGVLRELTDCYQSGEWFGEVATQLNKKAVAEEELRGRLGIDPSKKTAVIFPHIFWDGTFFWGDDLFGSYEKWFEAVLKEAARNPSVNWIIKVHPANLVKDQRDGYTGEHSEVSAIKRCLGELPEHIKLLPADAEISTLSLFCVSNYCLTVRGTVGIEAACFGIPVLTAGTGRYDRHGFTIDSSSREEYLGRLHSIQDIPPITREQVELACRYAYATLLCRPAPVRPFGLRFSKDQHADMEVSIGTSANASLGESEDLKRIARWIASGAEDFILLEHLKAHPSDVGGQSQGTNWIHHA